MKANLCTSTFFWGCRELLNKMCCWFCVLQMHFWQIKKKFCSLKLLWKTTQHPQWQIRCSCCKWHASAVCSPASHHAACWYAPLKGESNVGSNGGRTQEQASYEHVCYPTVWLTHINLPHTWTSRCMCYGLLYKAQRAMSKLWLSWSVLRNTGGLSLGATVTDWFCCCFFQGKCPILQCSNPVSHQFPSRIIRSEWSRSTFISKK